MADIDDEVLQDLYTWVDQIPLSRPKKSITRDYADGVLMAETVKHYFPKLVELHNFQACNALSQKKKNWLLLNWKVFKKLNFELSNEVIESIIQQKPGTIERVLLLLRTKMDRTLYDQQNNQGSSRRLMDGPDTEPHISPRRSPGRGSNLGGGMKKSGSLQNLAGGAPPPQPGSDFVSRLAYEEKVQDCLAKDETIEILQAKIRRLEHLLHLKDVRVDDLQARIEELRPTGQQSVAPGGPQPKRLPVHRVK